MYKIFFTFTKRGILRYISHLDLMRLFTRAIRRARLPVKISEGFSPRPKFSIKKALKLGVESDNEEASLVLIKYIDDKEFIIRLQEQLPEGVKIKTAHYLPV